MRYLLKGYDAWGKLTEEYIEIKPVTLRERTRVMLCRLLGLRLARRLGLTYGRYITGINVSGRLEP